MSELRGTNISAPIVPFTDLDKYPTHQAIYGKGGHKEVDTLTDLGNIPAFRLTIGSICYVRETGTTFRCTKFKHVDGTLFESEADVVESDLGSWEEISSEDIVVSDNEPAVRDQNKIWFDTGSHVSRDIDASSEEIASLNKSVASLQKQVESLLSILNYGVVAGDSSNSWRHKMIGTTGLINPGTGEAEGDTIRPATEALKHTVPNISIKVDTAQNFKTNYQNLIDGELIWITDQGKDKEGSLFIYIGGKFKQVSTTGGSGVVTNPTENNNMSAEELRKLIEGGIDFNSLDFVDLASNKYSARVNENGNLIIYRNDRLDLGQPDSDSKGGNYVSHFLNISSVFCGGDNDEHSFISCSHNFVELSNSSTSDINLNGLYLLYRPGSTSNWEWLPLVGTIKAGSTFLVRGAQCSNVTNTTIINVDSYDLQWYKGNTETGKINPARELIKFDQTGSTFYLCWGSVDAGGTIQIYKSDKALHPVSDLSDFLTPYSSDVIPGYVDSVGIRTGAGEGGQSVDIAPTSKMDNCLFFRWYYLDPSTQAYKAYSARNSKALWTYIDLTVHEDKTNVLKSYFKESDKVRFTPRSSAYGKNLFTTNTTFDPSKPNYVNLTFGRQATHNEAGRKKASRCLNWISVGYYDEFVEYKKTSSAGWTKLNSITENSIKTGGDYAGDSNVKKFINQYKRIRWIATSGVAVTTHKVIIRDLEAGTYQYRVRREGDESYTSDILTFTVYADSVINARGYSFIQVTDQQGFNYMEYIAWKKSASFIAAEENESLFTINTGDITQSGNRENEWLDYYEGREALRGKEEMFTIGNNDLCGKNEYELGNGIPSSYKINHTNVVYYYTFELDENNPAIFKYRNGARLFNKNNTTKYITGLIEDGQVGGNAYGFEYYMPSLYSFNFGDYHFVSINSEFRSNTVTVYTSLTQDIGKEFLSQCLGQLEDWFRKDLLLWKGTNLATIEADTNKQLQPSDCYKTIVFTHEMPFTIVTVDKYKSKTDRGGSKLNGVSSNGGSFRWSRLFKKYGIRLVMGGHKHTYSMSRPIYDAPENYIVGNRAASGVDLMSGNVEGETSSKPVVQVTSLPSDAATNTNLRYELVGKINAPVYVMSQATGYKLVSNQEIPSSTKIAWLQKYYPGKEGTGKDKEGIAQHFPTYVKYKLTATGIEVESIQITGIWGVDLTANTTTYLWNNWNDATRVEDIKSLGKQSIDLGEGIGTKYNIVF